LPSFFTDRTPVSAFPNASLLTSLRDRLGAVQCQHHSDMRVHQRPAIFRCHDYGFASRLPFGGLLCRFWKLQDIRRGVLERHD
jgi:hypothetical protein